MPRRDERVPLARDCRPHPTRGIIGHGARPFRLEWSDDAEGTEPLLAVDRAVFQQRC